jgi:hypothetical protein
MYIPPKKFPYGIKDIINLTLKYHYMSSTKLEINLSEPDLKLCDMVFLQTENPDSPYKISDPDIRQFLHSYI